MAKRKKKEEPWHLRPKRRRKINELPLRKRYLICTEGKTEAIYFSHYRSSTGPIVVPLDKSDHKVSLVNKAVEERNTRIQNGEFNEDIDETWVVLDRDAHPLNKLDKFHFNQALERAESNNIVVAYSNDAFELWFLLHFIDLQSATHRNDLVKMLSKQVIGKYVKPCDLYKEIIALRPTAIKRAKNLLKSKNPPESANPSTTVHQLVEKLINEPGYREED